MYVPLLSNKGNKERYSVSYLTMQDRTVTPNPRNPVILSSARTASAASAKPRAHRLQLAATLALALSLPVAWGLSGCKSKNPIDPAEVNAAQAGPPQDANGNVLLSDGTYGPPQQGTQQQPSAGTPVYPTVPRASAPAAPQVASRASYPSPARRDSDEAEAADQSAYPDQQDPAPQQYPDQQQDPNQQYPSPDQYPAQQQPGYGQGYPQQDPGDPYETGNPYENQTYQQDAYNDGYQQGYEAGIEASEPPPPLPVYEQPPWPGDGYLWNPGYWHYSPAGYYWVPGAWVLAPYTGALWTPGWWGFFGNRYRWHHGYWGPHIGFYGGIPYGYGYTGEGFHGGYWDHDHFRYNRSVTNIRVTNITNTYNTVVINNVVNNRHVSYNGGQGGLNVRPTPSEFAAMREQHVRPLPAQQEHAVQASQNHLQYAKFNQGRPAVPVAERPIQVQRLNVAPTVMNPGVRGVNRPTPPIAAVPAPRPGQLSAPNRPATQPGAVQTSHASPQPGTEGNGVRPNAPIQQRPTIPAAPAPNRPQQPTLQRPSPVRPQAPTNPPAPVPRQEPRTFSPPPQARPEPAPQPRPQIEQPRPEPRPEPRPQIEQPRPAPRPEPPPQHEAPHPPAHEDHPHR